MLPKEITSLQHPIVKHWAKLQQTASYRKETGRILVVGEKMTRELSPHTQVHAWITTDRQKISNNSYLITPEIMKKISGIPSPETIAAEISLPRFENPSKIHRLLILDNLSDPGNLGTLFRTAKAFNWDAIFLFGNCVDPYNDKSLRSAKGASLSFPHYFGDELVLQKWMQDYHLPLMIADLNGEPPEKLHVPEKFALVLGNESRGPSPFFKSHPRVTIPIHPDIDSLNVGVAGGILLYLMGEKV